MSDDRNCHLCGEAARDRSRDLIAELAPDEEYGGYVAAESDRFVVIPSIGPLSRGHVLLCPRRHVRGLARLEPAEAEEFEDQRSRISLLLSGEFGLPVHGFEHGAGASGDVPCSVEHAHFHFVPAAVDVRSRILSDYSWTGWDGRVESLRSRVDDREYIWYQAPDGECYLTTGVDRFPSQYMRRVFAETLGSPNTWNWRDWSDMPTLLDTFARVRFAATTA